MCVTREMCMCVLVCLLGYLFALDILPMAKENW